MERGFLFENNKGGLRVGVRPKNNVLLRSGFDVCENPFCLGLVARDKHFVNFLFTRADAFKGEMMLRYRGLEQEQINPAQVAHRFAERCKMFPRLCLPAFDSQHIYLPLVGANAFEGEASVSDRLVKYEEVYPA